MIDARAIISPKAQLAKDVSVGPWSIIGPDVIIDSGTKVGPHVVIQGPTIIGKNNTIFQFNSLGEQPQDKKYQGEPTRLEIGDNNIIREFCTFNRGTIQGGEVTRIGDDNLFMAYVHIAHDCIIGNGTIFSNNASLAGHVVVDDFVTFGGFSGVHQYCHIGMHSFISKAMITKDVVPFVIVSGHEPSVYGLNLVGLKRRGFSADTLAFLQRAYKIIFRQGLTSVQAIDTLKTMLLECSEIQLLIDALSRSERGIVR